MGQCEQSRCGRQIIAKMYISSKPPSLRKRGHATWTLEVQHRRPLLLKQWPLQLLQNCRQPEQVQVRIGGCVLLAFLSRVSVPQMPKQLL